MRSLFFLMTFSLLVFAPFASRTQSFPYQNERVAGKDTTNYHRCIPVITKFGFNSKCFIMLNDSTLLIGGAEIDFSRGKMDPEGAAVVGVNLKTGPLWEKAYGQQGLKRITVLKLLKDGSVLAAGGSIRPSEKCLLLSQEGKLLKEISLPVPGTVYDAIETEAGIILAGHFSDGGDGPDGPNGTYGALLMDRKGKLLWKVILSDDRQANPIDDFIRKILPTEDGFLLAGTRNREIVAFKINTGGAVQWETVVDSQYSETNDAIIHSSGNLWLTGQGDFHNKKPEPAGGIFVASLSPAGKVLWRRYYESKYSASGEGFVQLVGGKVLLLTRLTGMGINAGLFWLNQDGSLHRYMKIYHELTQIYSFTRLSEFGYGWLENEGINSSNPDVSFCIMMQTKGKQSGK